MDLRAIAGGYALGRALQLDHPELDRSAVLCSKLIAVLWLATGQVVYLRGEPVPFFGLGVPLIEASLFPQLMIVLQLLAILTIVCSRFTRSGCVLLASTVVLLSLSDQPLFSNNRLFCAAILGMLALGGEALARLQLAVVYAAAGIDKWIDADWRDGTFLRSFSQGLCRVGELWSPGWDAGAQLPLACALSAQLPVHPWLAVACSALVICVELSIALGYALGSTATVPLVVCFHGLLFVVTGSSFGMFFYAGLAAALLTLRLERMPAPLDRGGFYAALAVLLAGPWVRPWLVLAVLTALAVGVYLRGAQPAQVEEKRG